eukprot:GHUV01037925.1.p1 GENE.GHUV01037925.1~~GHUV01037925.1.p1  ORF type:complete len:140 (+),score=44.04 GHUV01037925.1:297-716(+)
MPHAMLGEEATLLQTPHTAAASAVELLRRPCCPILQLQPVQQSDEVEDIVLHELELQHDEVCCSWYPAVFLHAADVLGGCRMSAARLAALRNATQQLVQQHQLRLAVWLQERCSHFCCSETVPHTTTTAERSFRCSSDC